MFFFPYGLPLLLLFVISELLAVNFLHQTLKLVDALIPFLLSFAHEILEIGLDLLGAREARLCQASTYVTATIPLVKKFLIDLRHVQAEVREATLL